MDCNPKYKICELLQSTTLLHITDTWLIPVCTETQVRIGGGCWNTQLSMSVVPRRSCFSSISIIPYRELWYFTTLALISSHFYEMMLSAAFAWCLLLSSNSKILQSSSGEGKKKKTSKTEKLSAHQLFSNWCSVLQSDVR